MSQKDYDVILQMNIGKGNGSTAVNRTNRAAYLELGDSTNSTKALLLPRGDTTDVTFPIIGLLFYNLSDSTIYQYNGTSWTGLGSGSGILTLNQVLHAGNTSDLGILLSAAGAVDIGVQVENGDGASASIFVLDDVGLLSLTTPTTSGLIYPPVSGSRTYQLPSVSGTIALTSDIVITNFANANLTQTAARTYAGAGFNYTLNDLGHWTFNMATGKDFLINNASFFAINSSTNYWELNGKSGGPTGNYIKSDDGSEDITIRAGRSVFDKSEIIVHPDSAIFKFGNNGTAHIDSLRDGTSDDEIMTWNAGMWRKVAGVKYNFTGLADWDKLRYNSSASEWVNFTPAYTSDTTNLRSLVKNISTGVEYYTDLGGSGNDTTRIIQEIDDIADLEDAVGNVAIVDGRLWVKISGTDTWRRQAYDSTFTPAETIYFTDDFTGTNDTYINSRTTTTGGLSWDISAGSGAGTKLYSPPGAIRAELQIASPSRYFVDVTQHDIDLRGTLSQVQASTPLVFLILAFTDDNNFIQVNMVSGAVTQTVASTPTSLYAGSGTSVAGDVVRANLNGTTLTVYRNGVSLTSVSVSGALTGTKHGIYFYNDGGSGGSEITYIEGRQAE